MTYGARLGTSPRQAVEDLLRCGIIDLDMSSEQVERAIRAAGFDSDNYRRTMLESFGVRSHEHKTGEPF